MATAVVVAVPSRPFELLDFSDEILEAILLALPPAQKNYASVDRVCRRLRPLLDPIWRRFFLHTDAYAAFRFPHVQNANRTWKWLAEAHRRFVGNDSSKSFEIGYRDVSGQYEYHSASKIIYAGEFQKGHPCGFGILSIDTTEVTIGHFGGGYLNGHGTRWENGIMTFTGVFNDGRPMYGERPEIHRTFSTNVLSRYVGFFSDTDEDDSNIFTCPHGMGTLFNAKGPYYRGEINRGQMHGFGIGLNGNGDNVPGVLYRGGHQNGEVHGWGILEYGDGCVYEEGQQHLGRKHGLGRQTYPGGITIIGKLDRYDKDHRDCFFFGTLTYPNGCSYTGTFCSNDLIYRRVDGEGTFRWPDGCAFTGLISSGCRVSGLFTSPDGRSMHQNWIKSLPGSALFDPCLPLLVPAKQMAIPVPVNRKRKGAATTRAKAKVQALAPVIDVDN